MKLKRIMAFTLAAGLMMSSMTVFAATDHGQQEQAPDNAEEGDTYQDKDGNSYTYTGGSWVQDKNQGGGGTQEPTKPTEPSTPSTGGSSSSASDSSDAVSVPCGSVAPAPVGPRMLTREEIMGIIMQAETVALQATARDEGFADIADMQTAAAKNMSAGEYYNNAVVETPGIEEATPVAQGSGIIINGVVTNAMATISKVDVAFVDSVRASVEGTVLNVVDVQFPAVEATINFYMPGVTADANIAAVQYVDGAWVDVEVSEVRADHVVLNLKQNGKVAFLAK